MSIKGGRPNERRVTAHLLVNDATAAVDFYQRALGAEVLYRSTMPGGQTIHAHLKIGQGVFMVTWADLGEGGEPHLDQPKTGSPDRLGGTSVILEMYVDDVDAAFRRAVDAGATPCGEPEDSFFGDRYVQVTDPFGHVWALATVVEELTPAQIDERAMAQFG